MKKSICLLLAVLILFGLLSLPAAAKERYEDTAEAHNPIAYSEMQWEDFDEAPVYEAAEALSSACLEANNQDEVSHCYHRLMDALDVAETKNNLAELAYYGDVSNVAAAEGSLRLSVACLLLRDEVCSALSKLMESEYASVLIQDIGMGAYSFLGYERMSEEEMASLTRENEMIQQYGTASTGQEYSYEELAEIFIQLMAEWKQQADSFGYDSYRSYAYECLYYREYTPQEAADYREYVKEYLVPLETELADEMLQSDCYYELWQLPGPEAEDILNLLENHMEDISPELLPALRCMLDYGLYDMECGSNRAEVGFTTNLYSYGVPFLFNMMYGDAEDYANAVHEFGHFNEMYHHAGYSLLDYSDYDLCEVHSQGLELLFLEYAEDMVGEPYQEVYCQYILWSMLSSITEGCLYDEFLELAFEETNPTPDSLKELYCRVSCQYGYDGSDGELWTEVSHNFETPFYYISYSVSAMASLELYAESLDNRDKAIETYLKLTALPTDTGFLTAVKKVGMDNPLQKKAITAMAASLKERFLSENTTGAETKGENVPLMLALGAGGLVLVIAVLTVGAVRQRKKEERQSVSIQMSDDDF